MSKKILTYPVQQLSPGTPMGIYSGGPNEQGYANPQINANRHNTGNHIVQDSWWPNEELWEQYGVRNGMPYSNFPGAYSGNLIYDINDYLFRGEG